VPVPVWFNVDPLGDSLISELPDGLVGVVGVDIPVPGLACPVVEPGGLPDAGTPPAVPVADVPAPAVPPGPAACANVIELPSASAPANAIVASFMSRSSFITMGQPAKSRQCSLHINEITYSSRPNRESMTKRLNASAKAVKLFR